ncbi:MAG: hypothetical protein ACXWV4_10220 [Flavitalea sp.]
MRFLLPFILLLTGATCKKEQEPLELFSKTPVESPIDPSITEASGICMSMKYNNHLWIHEDSGNPPQLTLIKNDGTTAGTIYLKGATNFDWEEITRYSSANKEFLMIGDIGDNNRVRSKCILYILEEPSITTDTITAFQEIQFSYADGARDAEAFVIEPSTLDLFIFSKETAGSTVYKLTYPYSGGMAEPVTTISQNMITAASVSPDGKELLVKSYFNINYYKITKGSIVESLKTDPTAIAYTAEPQGEAIGFSTTGFFTLSEGNAAKLRFYKRN